MPNQHINKVALSDGTTLIDLTLDTVQASGVLSGQTFHDASGATLEGSCTYDSDTSEDTAIASEILATKSAHARGGEIVGTMPNRGAIAGTISDADTSYVVPSGYHDGTGTVDIASTEKAKLIARNIRNGVTILGVTGSMTGREDEVPQTKSVTPSFSTQQIIPDSGYTCLTEVDVAPITITYSDNVAGGQTAVIGPSA